MKLPKLTFTRYTPQTAISWLVFLTIFGIMGYIVFDGYMLSIPFSLAAINIYVLNLKPELETTLLSLISFLGIIGCFGIARHYKPPRPLPNWVWILLAITGFGLGFATGSGALLSMFMALLAPALGYLATLILTYLVIWLLTILFSMFAFALMVIIPLLMPIVAPYLIMLFFALAIISYIAFLLTATVALATIVLSNRLVSISLSAFGERRGVGIGVACIVKSVTLPFEATMFVLSAMTLFILAHIYMSTSTLITLVSQYAIRVPTFYLLVYLYVYPGLGITAAMTSAFALTKLLMKQATSLFEKISSSVRADMPWLTAVFVTYCLQYLVVLFVLHVAILLVIVLTFMCASTFTAVCFARRIKSRETAAFNSAITTLYFLYPLALNIGFILALLRVLI